MWVTKDSIVRRCAGEIYGLDYQKRIAVIDGAVQEVLVVDGDIWQKTLEERNRVINRLTDKEKSLVEENKRLKELLEILQKEVEGQSALFEQATELLLDNICRKRDS